MIRKEAFALGAETFASQRREILNRADEELTDPATWSVLRFGLPGWDDNLVDAALKIFTRTAEEQVDEWSPILDDMRGAFEAELRETLKKTTRAKDPDAQMQSLVRWVSTMSINAATEAAATSDLDEEVGLQWITMGDSNVRHSHAEANGQTVPSGQPFSIDGEELLYPGQPVGDPSIWYQCRCVVAPTMLSSSLVAAAKAVDTNKMSVIVALPAASDPINSVSSEEDGAHVTLLFLGDSAAFDPAPILEVLRLTAEQVAMPMTDPVNGRAVLGEHSADVALIDAQHLANIRGVILATDEVRAVHDGVEQFPAWIPHLTLGYPETPRLSDDIPTEITFDRLALWHGEEKTEFTMEAKPVESIVAAAEMPEGGEEIRWYGVLAPEGVMSGDKRTFAPDSLGHRELPLPLKYMPVDDEAHKGSFIVARIDRIFRENGLIKAEGVFDKTPESLEAARRIKEQFIRGVSVDLDDVTAEIDREAKTQTTTSGRISAATICAIGAFAETWIKIGTWADEPVTKGDELEPSGDSGELALVASAVMAEAEVAYNADWFRNPNLDGPTPLTITDEGRVYGHLAAWDTCHIGSVDRDGGCVTAPESHTNYAYFLTGEVVTDAGRVAVGQISMGAGHASERMGLRAAASHYDSTSASVADITVGEDDYGIWVAGSMRDGITPSETRKLMASALSGDWRRVVVGGRGNLELVAALAVNVPGFPIPRTKFSYSPMGQSSLIAAGVVPQRGDVFEGDVTADKIKIESFGLVEGQTFGSTKLSSTSESRTIIRKARVAAAKSRINK